MVVKLCLVSVKLRLRVWFSVFLDSVVKRQSALIPCHRFGWCLSLVCEYTWPGLHPFVYPLTML